MENLCTNQNKTVIIEKFFKFFNVSGKNNVKIQKQLVLGKKIQIKADQNLELIEENNFN